jgi:hypothetical protein
MLNGRARKKISERWKADPSAPEDLRAIEDASSRINLEGASYPKFHEQLAGR